MRGTHGVLAVLASSAIAGAIPARPPADQVVPMPRGDTQGRVVPLSIPEQQGRRIVAEGLATVHAGNVQAARLAALRSAYAEAVARGTGLEVGSMTLIKNVKYVTDIVTSRSRGLIREYRIISEGLARRDPSKYEVVIDADVVESGTTLGDDRNAALAAYLEILGRPRLLIILPERAVATPSRPGVIAADSSQTRTDVELQKGDLRVRLTEGSTNARRREVAGAAAPELDAGDRMRSTEAAVAQAFSRLGYDVMTSDDLLDRNIASRTALAEARSGVTAAAVDVARAAGADLALLGVLRVSQEHVRPVNVDLVMVTTEASAKAIVVSSGKVIDAFHRTERASHPQGLKAYADSLDKIAAGIAEALGWNLPRILTNEFRETTLRVRGLSLAQAMDLKDALAGIDGVESVRVTQVPTDRSPETHYSLLSGFLFVEPAQVVDVCTRSLRGPVRLISATKFEIDAALESR